MQFRAIDYGMETCELKLTMDSDTSVRTSSSPFELEIFRLNATIPLDRKSTNYKTRPPRLAKVASIQVDPRLNTTWHRNFGCASDDVLTFEVACQPDIEDADCHLEWWQTNQHPTSGQRSFLTTLHIAEIHGSHSRDAAFDSLSTTLKCGGWDIGELSAMFSVWRE